MGSFFPVFDIREHKLLIIGLLVCFYFSYHLLYGPRSFSYLQNVQSENVLLSQKLSELKAEEAELESRVVKLRPETLDEDLLKERARVMLGYTNENEIIILEE